MKKMILCLMCAALSVGCASRATSSTEQGVSCTQERGDWQCIGPEFEGQLVGLAPPEDAQLWAECQDIAGARTCCLGVDDRPRPDSYACCQDCVGETCTEVFCVKMRGVFGWHF